MDYYRHERLDSHSYVITEVFPGETHGHAMALFVGTDRACIVDSGWGVTGNLREYVGRITDLPVICMLTHPHPDHAGAAVLFTEVYMNPLDEPIAAWALQKEKRMRDASRKNQDNAQFLAEMEREVIDCSGFSYHAVKDGDRFDLGGVCVEAIGIPGHTPGSMAYYCREDDVLCTGDAVGENVTLVVEQAVELISVRVYERALARLFGKITPDTKLIAGHTLEPLSVQTIRDLLSACNEAVNGRPAPASAGIRIPPFAKEAGVPVHAVAVNGTVLVYAGI